MFMIRRRSSKEIVERGYKNREAGKKDRDRMNTDYYKKGQVPSYQREYYITRSHRHRCGPSK